MQSNKAVKVMLVLCAACLLISVLCLKLMSGLPDKAARERLNNLNEQQVNLKEAITAKAEEIETVNQDIAKAQESLRAAEEKRDSLSTGLEQVKSDKENAQQVLYMLEDLYSHYTDLFYYDFQVLNLSGNNDVDGAYEMENRDGMTGKVISFIDNPLLNAVTAEQQAQRGQISSELMNFNRTFSEIMDRYTPRLLEISKMDSVLKNCLTLAEEAVAHPEKLHGNMEILRNILGEDISAARFEDGSVDALDAMLRLEACIDMALRAYKVALSDSSGNAGFLRDLERLRDSTQECYYKYETPEMTERAANAQPERAEIQLEMLKATKKLMDTYCATQIGVAQLGPGINGNSKRVFKAGIGYVEIHWTYKQTDTGPQLLTAFEYADTGMGSHMMAVHYYDLDGKTVCIDSLHSGVTIYLKDSKILESTVDDSEKYIAQSQKLKSSILSGTLDNEYFDNIYFDTVHKQ